MERLRQIITLALFLFGVLSSFAQVDLTQPDSIPEIPTFTDTVAVDTIVTDTVSNGELDSAEEETYIHLDEDTLYWGRDSMTLVHFYERLDQLLKTKQGNLNILHIGGSHVQAGTMTHRIRKHLLDEFGEPPASRGLIFPYSATNSNNCVHLMLTNRICFTKTIKKLKY